MPDAFVDSLPPATMECFSSHMVPWLIVPSYLRSGLSMTLAGIRPSHANILAIVNPQAAKEQADVTTAPAYITEDGIGVIVISGAMMKPRSKFGGTSSVDVRRQVRAMASSKDVRGIMLHIDSPGGTVAGTEELANDIQLAKEIKLVSTHFADMGASAALWIGVQADKVTANSTAMVGSLGTVAVMYDESKAAEMQGVKVHVISTGLHKGAGISGTPVLPEHIEEAQRLVDALNDQFMEAVVKGRGMTREAVDALADGRVWLAEEAKALGLIDGVMSFDQSMQQFRNRIAAPAAGISMRNRQAQALLLSNDI